MLATYSVPPPRPLLGLKACKIINFNIENVVKMLTGFFSKFE